jgi:poly(A) polymerase
MPMLDCEQGKYHHLDVWNHTLLVLKNARSKDYILSLGCLLHDVGKPPTRMIDEHGNTRFFSHDTVGADISKTLLRRLKFSEKEVDRVAKLVKNHMRLGTAKVFTPAAARRVLRDMGDQTEDLLQLVEADCNALKPGVKAMDLSKIRETLAYVAQATPIETLSSPLSGEDIMRIKKIPAGTEVGRFKNVLTEMVLDGKLAPGDKTAAERALRKVS